jgi:hypothetical protein
METGCRLNLGQEAAVSSVEMEGKVIKGGEIVWDIRGHSTVYPNLAKCSWENRNPESHALPLLF